MLILTLSHLTVEKAKKKTSKFCKSNINNTSRGFSHIKIATKFESKKESVFHSNFDLSFTQSTLTSNKQMTIIKINNYQ